MCGPFITVGKEFYTTYNMPYCHTVDEAMTFDEAVNDRYRLVLFEEGSSLLQLGERRTPLMAPALGCFDELERPQLENAANLKMQAIIFHPRMINKALNPENIRSKTVDKADTAWLDLYYLRAFTVRKGSYQGILQLGPSALRRIAELFQAIRHELTAQPDNYWTCRSRSHLISLLNLVTQVYETPAAVSAAPLTEKDSDVDPVILYLHANYHQKISLTDLTREFHVNRTTLTERFAKVTGTSFLDYLNRLRIQVASAILRDTKLPVNEIMSQVGYSDMTHFGRVFRKYTGHTPSDYRQSIQH
jgi:AraC-like DNA-binding protein